MYRDPSIRSSEITPESLYLSRRALLGGIGALGAGLVLSACGLNVPSDRPGQAVAPDDTTPRDELGDPANSFEQITNYNNFYEFTTDKEAVAHRAAGFVTHPWTVEVTGWYTSHGSLLSKISSRCSTRKSAFIVYAASKGGQWSSPGRVSRSTNC